MIVSHVSILYFMKYTLLMFSLSPRFDLFRFEIPKDYIPDAIRNRYDDLLSKKQGVITNSIDYLNESIQGVNIPGMSDLVHEQQQVSHNSIERNECGLGRINIEASHVNSTYSSENPLSRINKEIIVKFRLNQGLYNYLMMYETIMYKYVRSQEEAIHESSHDVFTLSLLSDDGLPTARILFYQPKISGIDGLEFSYNKVDREFETFDLTFVYNNVDFVFSEGV